MLPKSNKRFVCNCHLRSGEESATKMAMSVASRGTAVIAEETIDSLDSMIKSDDAGCATDADRSSFYGCLSR